MENGWESVKRSNVVKRSGACQMSDTLQTILRHHTDTKVWEREEERDFFWEWWRVEEGGNFFFW